MPQPRNREASSSDPTPSPTTTPVETLEAPAVNLFGPLPESPTSPPPDPSWSSPSDPSSSELGADFGSGPRSTAEAAASGDWRKRRRELVPVMETAVRTVGGLAHATLTVEGTPERDAELYLPDSEDVEAISEPLAGLASRRLPAGPENPDVSDLIGLAVGLVGYVVKQLRKRSAARAAKLPAPEVDHTPDDAEQ